MRESTTYKFTRFREKVKDKPHYNRQKEKFSVQQYSEDPNLNRINGDVECWKDVSIELNTIAERMGGADTEELRIALSHQIGLIAEAISEYCDNEIPF